MQEEIKIKYLLTFIILLFVLSCWRLYIARKPIFEQCPEVPIRVRDLLAIIVFVPAVNLFNNFWKYVFGRFATRFIKEDSKKSFSLKYSERVKKFSYNGYKLMYHLLASCLEILIMKDIGWNIGYLFGKFDTSFYNIFYEKYTLFQQNQIVSSYPCAPFPLSWKLLYLLQLSCYLEKIIFGHQDLQGRRDKFEMICHHFISLMLIFISIFNMHHRIGFFILIWRDISDVFMYLSKFFLTFWTKMSVISIIIGLFIWAYSRNYQHLIYLCSASVLFVYNNHNKIELFCSYIEVAFIYFLAILDYLWFILIILSLLKYNKDGVVGNKCEESDSIDSTVEEKKTLKQKVK